MTDIQKSGAPDKDLTISPEELPDGTLDGVLIRSPEIQRAIIRGIAADTVSRNNRMGAEDRLSELRLRFAHKEAIAKISARIVIAILVCGTIAGLALADTKFYESPFFKSPVFTVFLSSIGALVSVIVGFERFVDWRTKHDALDVDPDASSHGATKKQ